MKSCSSVPCVLILLITTFTPGSESATPTVTVNITVKLNDSATLPCSERCSGVVRWTVYHKTTEVLAECNQTSCRSKKGYQMIHDQYLNGNYSLIITAADFSKRSSYTCDCDGTDLCDVELKIESVDTAVRIKPGEVLQLKVDSPDPVEVTYNSMDTAGPSSGQTGPQIVCSVKNHELQCYEGYEDRVSLTSVLELRGLTQSDSGVYTVRDSTTKEVISIYRVTVDSTHSGQKAVNTTVKIKPGEALQLKIDSPDPVEVTYMDTAGPSSGQTDPRTLCSVKNHKLRCDEGYEDRVSLTSVLELRGLTQSDSGVYTVRDSTTKEVISIYRVTVDSTHRSGLQDDQTDPGPAGPGRTVPVWGTVLLSVSVSVCVIVGLVVVVTVRQRKRNQRMRNEIEMNEHNNLEEKLRLSSPTTNEEVKCLEMADDQTEDLSTRTS